MKLTHKLFYIEIAFFAVLMLSILIAVKTLALPEVNNIEKEQLAESFHRVKEYIHKDLSRMKKEAADWAEWDDTYQYVYAPYKEYETSNLIPDTLETLDIDLLLIINERNEYIKSTLSSNIPESSSLINTSKFEPDHILVSDAHFKDFAILTTEAGPLMMAKNTILTSRSEGPSRGTLYFGKIIDDDYIVDMNDALKHDFSIQTVSEVYKEPTIEFLHGNQSHLSGFIRFANSSNISLKVDIYQERSFYNQVLNVTLISLVAISGIGAICCLITYLILRRLLIDPILLLQKQADFFKNHSSESDFSLIKRDDEIGQLSSSFVAMAKEISSGWNKLNEEKALLKNESLTDTLTQAKNRRFLESLLNTPSSWKTASSWSFIALDLDHFKLINDTYGHEYGDAVLKRFSDTVKQCCREQDFFIRTGGEEFLLICRGISIEATKSLVERILLSIRQSDFGHETHSNITCSVGFFCVNLTPTDSELATETWPDLLKIADLALYAAKNNGRDTWIGLFCTRLCNETKTYKNLPPIKQWLSSKQIELLSPKTLPDDFQWIE